VEDAITGERLMVDASDLLMTRVARFASHSCNPNAQYVCGAVDGRKAILLCSKSEPIVGPGEVTCSYGWKLRDMADGDGPTPCRCGDQHCRGIIEM